MMSALDKIFHLYLFFFQDQIPVFFFNESKFLNTTALPIKIYRYTGWKRNWFERKMRKNIEKNTDRHYSVHIFSTEQC